MKTSEKLKELGIVLPPPPRPVGSYVSGLKTGNLVFVSGQIPLENGAITLAGKVGKDATLEEAQAAARRCALSGLAIAA
ncbi:MAG: RidA family protein, partial [Phycisphaerales bacterium]|nr:RidA family protein [Phycisphaerales bacterium]